MVRVDVNRKASYNRIVSLFYTVP